MAGGEFTGLSISSSGVNVARLALDVIAHNITNANTKGYSRQIMIQQAATPLSMADGKGMLGAGTDCASIDRMRDKYQDLKYRDESSIKNEWGAKNTNFNELQTYFNDISSDDGFNKTYDQFNASLQELSKNPSDIATRIVVREKALTFTKNFNDLASKLEDMQDSLNQQVSYTVDRINFLASQIATTNEQIRYYESSIGKANDLRDQRDRLVDDLSKLVNIEANEIADVSTDNKNTIFVVTIGGIPLVDNITCNKMKCVTRDTKLNQEDIDKLYDVKLENNSNLNIKSGEIKGLLDMRDGNEGDNNTVYFRGIPFYVKKLNEFARNFAMVFNEGYIDKNSDGQISNNEIGNGHVDGYGISKDASSNSPTGIRFFAPLDDNGVNISSESFIPSGDDGDVDTIVSLYQNITAKNFSLSKDILTDVYNIATSDTENQAENTGILKTLIGIKDQTYLYHEGTPGDFIKSLTTTLGIDANQAKITLKGEEKFLLQIESQRADTSAVSINEEMMNVVQYQQAFSASARMISVMAELFDTLLSQF